MRKAIRRGAGWVHETLILAMLIPIGYAMGMDRKPQVEDTVFLLSLFILVPIVITGIAMERCRTILQYLLICAITLTVTGIVVWQTAEALSYGSTAQACVTVFVAETLFVMAEHIFGRLNLKKRKDAKAGRDLDWLPEVSLLEHPRYYTLVYFFLVYAAAKNVASKSVCDAALLCAFVSFLTAILYQYIDRTEQYLSLNKRVCNLPGKRIYGISGAVLAIFLLAVVVVSVPAFLTSGQRRYTDFRILAQNRVNNLQEFLEEQGELEDPVVNPPLELTERKSLPPEVVFALNLIFYLLAAAALVVFVYGILKSIRQASRDFRDSHDENGDLVEELEEVVPLKKQKIRKKQGKPETEREKIRKQYRKTIRRHCSEVPYPFETPLEIEIGAGIERDEEVEALHVLYEQVRYGKDLDEVH